MKHKAVLSLLLMGLMAVIGGFMLQSTVMAAGPAPATSAGLTVTSPSAGEKLTMGQPATISWQLPPIKGITPAWSAQIELSTDGGKTFPTAIAKNLQAINYKYSWKASGPETTTAQIRVIVFNPIGSTPPMMATSGNFIIAR